MWQGARGDGAEGMEGLALCSPAHRETSRTWGDAELLRQSQVVQRGQGWWGRELCLEYLRHNSGSAALGPALPSMNILCERGHPDVREQLCERVWHPAT